MIEPLEQLLRRWCADMRREGYTEHDIFHALMAEAERLDLLAYISQPASKTV